MATDTLSRGVPVVHAPKLETSRRALIGGAGIAAVIAVGPMIGTARAATPSHDRAAWDAAVQTLAGCEAHDTEVRARFNAAEAAGHVPDVLEAEWDDSCSILCDAEWALFDTPAPDLEAVEWKLVMLRDCKFPLDDATASRLLADVRAISREG